MNNYYFIGYIFILTTFFEKIKYIIVSQGKVMYDMYVKLYRNLYIKLLVSQLENKF